MAGRWWITGRFGLFLVWAGEGGEFISRDVGLAKE